MNIRIYIYIYNIRTHTYIYLNSWNKLPLAPPTTYKKRKIKTLGTCSKVTRSDSASPCQKQGEEKIEISASKETL